MRATRTLEVGTGLFVLLGFAALVLPHDAAAVERIAGSAGAAAGYHVTAEFDNVGDLKTGSPVTMAGVRVGEVESIRFDSASYKAVVSLRIDSQYNRIPDDSDASVQTQGLLGGKYIGIGPGGSDTYLKDGGRDRAHAVGDRARKSHQQAVRELRQQGFRRAARRRRGQRE